MRWRIILQKSLPLLPYVLFTTVEYSNGARRCQGNQSSVSSDHGSVIQGWLLWILHFWKIAANTAGNLGQIDQV